MKQFLDFLPLVVFFAFYKLYDIYAATTALIVATAVVLIYSWVRYRTVEKLALLTCVLVAVFGGLTIFFHNDEFIKWKVTVIYALFAGALLFAYFLVHLTGVAASEPWNEAIRGIALAKVSMPWHVVLLKGIGANWLVCLAVWLGMCSRGTAGKILGLWFPVMCFVAIGYEHSIANMFFIPLGMMQGAEVGWGEFIGKNLIPATLGNIAGGAVFVGGLYWYVYGTGKTKE